MKFIKKYKSQLIYGLFVFPLSTLYGQVISQIYDNHIFFLIWMVITIIIPFFVVIFDWKMIIDVLQENSKDINCLFSIKLHQLRNEIIMRICVVFCCLFLSSFVYAMFTWALSTVMKK
jgi:hypothetical protein